MKWAILYASMTRHWIAVKEFPDYAELFPDVLPAGTGGGYINRHRNQIKRHARQDAIDQYLHQSMSLCRTNALKIRVGTYISSSSPAASVRVGWMSSGKYYKMRPVTRPTRLRRHRNDLSKLSVDALVTFTPPSSGSVSCSIGEDSCSPLIAYAAIAKMRIRGLFVFEPRDESDVQCTYIMLSELHNCSIVAVWSIKVIHTASKRHC